MKNRLPAARIAIIATLLLAAPISVRADTGTGVLTHHNDYLRTGANSTETILTPASLTAASNNFGVIATVNLDDTPIAQPLVVPNLPVSCPANQTVVTCGANLPGTFEVIFVATNNNTVYAINAANGQILLQRNFGAPASYCGGIKSTPVIDPITGRMFVITHTLVNSVAVHTLNAISVQTLMDAVTPYAITAANTTRQISDGTYYGFDSSVMCQKPALLLVGGKVYAAFNGKEYGVGTPPVLAESGRGWVLGWSTSNLTPVTPLLTDRYATSPNNYFLSSIWMSGAGIASDGANLYFSTGNSDPGGTTYSAGINIEESVVKVAPTTMTVASIFTPYNYAALDATDGDLGSGGVLVIPTSQPLIVTAGKDGRLFLLNSKSLGGYTPGGPDRYLDMHSAGDCWCAPSFFMGPDNIGRVVSSGGNTLMTWELTLGTSGTPVLTQEGSAQIPVAVKDPGFFTTTSSNGNSANHSRIIWAVGRPSDATTKAVVLYAFDAAVSNGTLPLLGQYNAGIWNNGGDANIVPVVANGKVSIAGTNGVGAGTLTILGFNASQQSTK